jgi:sporulation protein YlmC with PRC-barrel domain
MELPLGADVHCSDGRCGRSAYIILDPATGVTTHLVVRERQPSRSERLVPTKLVTTTAAEAILLNCTKEEFARLEPFNQTEFVYGDLVHHATDPSLTLLWPYAVPAKRIVDEKIRPIPPGELAVRRGARVHATDGQVGRVDMFLVDPERGHVTHMCLREGHLWGDKQVCIPVSEIDRIQEKVVHLKIDKEAVEALPSIPTKQWQR